jgi:hypothetical protein
MNDNLHSVTAALTAPISAITGAILRSVDDSGRNYAGNHESRVIRISPEKTPVR